MSDSERIIGMREALQIVQIRLNNTRTAELELARNDLVRRIDELEKEENQRLRTAYE